MRPTMKSHEALLAEEMARDPEFREHWEQTALARLVAAQLIKYRATNKLSQRALAEKLGKKQPYVARLEAGETNPDLETLVNISRALGIEFVIDIAPVATPPKLVTKEVAAEHATRRSGVSVVVAASSSSSAPG
jgi:transcriptional regulator with XRE-family HTH domain